MAITRCPYCHAIIDENVKYCNNCGTQLLFAEDEDTDDEIPGEKIIDAETEEKDYTVDEPEGEKRPKDGMDLDEDLEEEIEEEPEELALDKLVEEESGEGDVTGEVILVDEVEAAGVGGKNKPDEPREKAKTTVIKAAEEEEKKSEKEGTEEPRPVTEEAEPVVEYVADQKDRDEAVEEAVPQPVTFDTRELEGMGKTIDLGKVKVDEFLEGLAEKRAGSEAPPIEVREPTGTLPPWANVMKGQPVFSEESAGPETGEEGGGETPPTAGDEEVEIFPRRRDSDSTIGLPERVSQSPLPFERGEAEGEEEEEGEQRVVVRPAREPERRPLEVEELLEEPQPRPPFSFSVFFKSKAFDLLFVGLFWLVALWLAAHSMDMTLFEILGAMSGPMFLLYIVFVFMYFFLFKFFLGETLGDRLFRERE